MRYSDEDLLKLIAVDDEKAFKELFERYWKRAYAIAFSRLRSREVGEEIAMDVFVKFWERRRSFRVENFTRYLAVAIKYRVITYNTRELAQRKPLVGLNDLSAAQEELLSTTPVEYDELMSVIEQGVQALPTKTQHVFRMNRLEGRSVSEISHQLNLSEKAIQYHITRSVKELRVHLREYLLVLFSLAASV